MRRPSYAAVTSTLALVLADGGGAYAVSAPTSETIYTCVTKRGGELRVVKASTRCRRGERSLSFNQRGPVGPAGLPGAPGAQGPAGPAGAQGESGRDGAGGGNAVARRWYRDGDNDGYGHWYLFLDSPARPDGYVDDHSDCNDASAAKRPGVTDGAGQGDQDCDGEADEDRERQWYLDADLDGYGGATKVTASAPPAGYVRKYGDCNDADKTVVPYTANCHPNGDFDGDGHNAIGKGGSLADDCDDYEPLAFPGRVEIREDGIDSDCEPTTLDVLPRDADYLLPGH